LGVNLEPVLIKPDLIVFEFRTGLYKHLRTDFVKIGSKFFVLEPILLKPVLIQSNRAGYIITGYNKKTCNRLFYKTGSNNFNKIYSSATLNF
jgi:hypothetical protein